MKNIIGNNISFIETTINNMVKDTLPSHAPLL